MALKQCSKCIQDRNILASKLKLGQSILRKTVKIVATGGRILKLKCVKFDFAYSAPSDPLAGFKGSTSKGEESEGSEV